MKPTDDRYLSAFARGLCTRIHDAVERRRRYRLMSFCRSHALAIARHGFAALLPPQVQLIHGPGCPECVLPASEVDRMIDLARTHDVTLCVSEAMLRVPGALHTNLLEARAAGADIVGLEHVSDALALARAQPQREIVYAASGFETAAPATADALLQARALDCANFSVLCHHVLTPAAMRHLLADDAVAGRALINGFLAPSHVSQVIGVAPYRAISRDFVKPIVIAGPQATDVLQAVLILVTQINECRADTENQYTRAVTEAGDMQALKIMDEVFEVRESFAWRGMGCVPRSALTLRPAFAQWDAARRYALGSGDAATDVTPVQGSALASCRQSGTTCAPFTPFNLQPGSTAIECDSLASYRAQAV